MSQSKQIGKHCLKQAGPARRALALPLRPPAFTEYIHMKNKQHSDVIIIGGSYAGLSAAMALGRALRQVLIIDSGLPCNRQTPHAHNFITQDGEKPAVIAEKAKAQVLKYETVHFLNDLAISGRKTEIGFAITTTSGQEFHAQKLIFATGVRDLLPDIKGFSDCWGITVIHCPYCHGYEVKNETTGILANGDFALHYAQLIRNWTQDLTIFTNGKSTLNKEQREKIDRHQIPVIEKEISHFKHLNGKLEQLVFRDGTTFNLRALYARPAFEQHCKIPESLGCECTEHGLLQTDMFQKTNIPGIFACGDNVTMMRSVANAVATGNTAGAVVNNMMTEAAF